MPDLTLNISTERLQEFYIRIRRLLDSTPALFLSNSIANVPSSLASGQKNVPMSQLFDAIFQIVHARIIYDELPAEDTLSMILDIAEGNLKLPNPQSRLPYLIVRMLEVGTLEDSVPALK